MLNIVFIINTLHFIIIYYYKLFVLEESIIVGSCSCGIYIYNYNYNYNYDYKHSLDSTQDTLI